MAKKICQFKVGIKGTLLFNVRTYKHLLQKVRKEEKQIDSLIDASESAYFLNELLKPSISNIVPNFHQNHHLDNSIF